MNKKQAWVIVAALALAAGASAQPRDDASRLEADEERPCPGHKPPEEAFSACEESSEGDACSFSIDGDAVSGTCRTARHASDGELVCVPDPPSELSEACEGLAEGDTCSFTDPRSGDSIEGTCRPDRHDTSNLLCLPARGRGGRPGPPVPPDR